MISIENLSKGFGGQTLFENISLKINSGERIGLVGRNGHGKTTLIRLLVGDDQADEGRVVVPKHYRVGYVRQHIHFTKQTVLEECMTGLVKAEEDHYWKAEKILAGLGFSQKEMQQQPGLFSGGFQVRLNLAKVLVSEPDILLLDEPTNYLDITSIRWVKRYLQGWPHELMLVTHDRGFMDSVVTHVLGIHRHKIRKIPGNTEKYYNWIAQDEEVYEKTRLNDERRQKDIELFISRFRAKARLANMVQSRVKTLEKLKKKDPLEKINTLDFSFKGRPYRGKTLMRVKDAAFGYQTEKLLFSGLNITIGAKDRVCIVGKNGRGKTTLLKVLAEQLTPREGEVVYNPDVNWGIFEQTNVTRLNDAKTVEEEILYTHPDVNRQIARNISGAMMFRGDDALKKIGILSGGEKSRVMLGKLLVTPVNLLLLDEPTNHLDMASCDALLAAIDSFDGAVVIVTHNEMFLHALAERLIVFQDETVFVFEGDYQSFLDKGGWSDETAVKGTAPKHHRSPPISQKATKKELRQKRSEIITRRAKVLAPLQKAIARNEDEINTLEKTLDEHHQAIQEATQAGDGEEIARLSKSIHQCQSSIDHLFDDLESMTDTFEKESARFDNRLAALE